MKLQAWQLEAVAMVILRIPGYFVLNIWWEFGFSNSLPRSLAWSDVVPAGFALFGE